MFLKACINENHTFVFKKFESGKQHAFETGQIPFDFLWKVTRYTFMFSILKICV